jgi:hypothetical protein
MPNGRSRRKGKVGELDVVHRLGGSAKRVGHSYIATPVDVETNFAVYQVRNKTIGGSEIALELARLEAVAPSKNAYVVFKVKGKWYLAETMTQHVGDHGDKVKVEEDEKG